MLDVRKSKGKDDTTGGWIDAEHVYRWWIGENPLQITMEDYIKMLEEEQEVMEDYK